MIKSKVLGLLFIAICLHACKETKEESFIRFENEIMRLSSDNDKINYLEKILEDDQSVRGTKGQEIILKYGQDSKEYKAHLEAMWDMGEINLHKIESYLRIHGYPKKEFGELATIAPLLAINHSQGSEVREKYFPIIYGAYLTGDLDAGAISFYLGRMYEINHKKRFDIASPYKAEDEVNQLIEALGLKDLQENLHESLNIRIR